VTGISQSLCQKSISGSFVIEGKISLPFSGVAFIHYFDYQKNEYRKDSGIILQQQFKIQGFLKEPTYATLYLQRDKNTQTDTINTAYFLMIEPSTIQLQAGKYMNDLVVKGSVYHDDYVDFLKIDKSFQKSIDSVQALMRRSNIANDTLTSKKYHEFLKQLRKTQCVKVYSKMVFDKRNSIFSIFILQRMLRFEYNRNSILKLFLQLTPRIKNTNAAKELYNVL
jgi:hypothetical protein